MEEQRWLCVRFAPTDIEIFETFLIPKLALPVDEVLPDSLIHLYDFYQHDPVTSAKPGSLYFPADNYWYFVTRTRLNPRSTKPNRAIRTNPVLGKWRKVGKTERIVNGMMNLGLRHTFDYVNQQNLKTGWRMNEYERAAVGNAFQSMVVVHLVYKRNLDQTLHDQDLHDQQNFEDIFNDLLENVYRPNRVFVQQAE